MTEYDYSPEAYERYLATQNRIAHWVDNTEQHRAEFQPAVPTGSSGDLPMRSGGYSSYSSHNKLKKASPPPSTHHHHRQPNRQLFINPPPPESESSDSEGYGDGPGPMPLPSPGMMMAAQYPQAYRPMVSPVGQSMMSPPPMMMPPSYMVPPPSHQHKSSRHHHHRSHSSHHSSRSHRTPIYYNMASPPVSPGYQYAYPPPMGNVHPGYIMMPQQPHQRSTQPTMMSDTSQLPRSAPANVTTFSGMLSPPVAPGTTGYFQKYPDSASSSAFLSPIPSGLSTPHSQLVGLNGSGGGGVWSTYGVGSTPQSLSTPSTSPMGSPSGLSPPSNYIPQFQGIHSAMVSGAYLAPSVAPSQQQPVVLPQGLHQRVYDLSTGSHAKHYPRHSVG